MNSTQLKSLLGIGGSVITYSFGGWSSLLTFLLLLIAADYITGIGASVKEGRGLSSPKGFQGAFKKGIMFLVLLLAHRFDVVVGTHVVMDFFIWYFVSNEAISIVENLGRMNFPLPHKLKDIIEILRHK